MSVNDTYLNAGGKAPKDLEELVMSLLHGINKTADRQERSLEQHAEILRDLSNGQTNFGKELISLGQKFVHYEERHAFDIKRMDERFAEYMQRNEERTMQILEKSTERADFINSRCDNLDKSHIALADRVDSFKESVRSENKIISEHIVAMDGDIEANKAKWKTITMIITGTLVGVLTVVVLSVMSIVKQ